MHNMKRVGVLLALGLLISISGCTWISSWFNREPRSADVQHPGADVTFGIKSEEEKKAEAAKAANKAASAAKAGEQAGQAGEKPALDVTDANGAGANGAAGADGSKSTAAGAGGAAGAGDVAGATAGSGSPTLAAKEMAGAMADGSGAAAGGPVIDKTAIGGDALFQFGKSELTDQGRTRLDELAAKIQGMPQGMVTMVEVVGHADRLGTRATNKRLSEKRAASVAGYLVSKGVASNMIKSMGKGDTEPVMQCKGNKPTPEVVSCLAPNRRVEVVIHGK